MTRDTNTHASSHHHHPSICMYLPCTTQTQHPAGSQVPFQLPDYRPRAYWHFTCALCTCNKPLCFVLNLNSHSQVPVPIYPLPARARMPPALATLPLTYTDVCSRLVAGWLATAITMCHCVL
jgi:hypothetical protein